MFFMVLDIHLLRLNNIPGSFILNDQVYNINALHIVFLSKSKSNCITVPGPLYKPPERACL